MLDLSTIRFIRRIIISVLLGGLLFLGYIVLQPFIIPLAWAMIIAYATWPIYLKLRIHLFRHPTLASLVMTLILATAFILPAIWFFSLLKNDVTLAYANLNQWLSQEPYLLHDILKRIPVAGSWLAGLFDQLTDDPETFRQRLIGWAQLGTKQAITVLGDVGVNAAKLGFTLLSLFFMYRDGPSLFSQAKRVLYRFLGDRIEHYMVSISTMTTAVVWGFIATVIAQGIVAGFGYWFTDVPAPVFWAAITTLVAMIPFGTPFAWGGISIWLLLNDHLWQGIALLGWGTLVVSWVDNLVRPMVISSATQLPFLLIMFGVLGGLSAFGLVGLFLGPIILAVIMAIWKEWLEDPNSSALKK